MKTQEEIMRERRESFFTHWNEDLYEEVVAEKKYRLAVLKGSIKSQIREIIEEYDPKARFEFAGAPNAKHVTVRWGYWKPMPDDLFHEIKKQFPSACEDCYDDDDGDDDEGRPIIRRLWSTVVPTES